MGEAAGEAIMFKDPMFKVVVAGIVATIIVWGLGAVAIVMGLMALRKYLYG